MNDNPTFASQLVPLLFQIAAGTIDQADAETQLTTMLDNWVVMVSDGVLSQNIVSLMTQVQNLVQQFTGLILKGTVATVTDLPANSGAGTAYIVLSNGHLYGFINGVWQDCGNIQGAPGANAATSIGFQVIGGFNPGELIGVQTVPSPINLIAADTVGYVDTPGTGNVTFPLRLNGSAWGSITFTASSKNVVSAALNSTTLQAGDTIEIYAPGTLDATFQNFSVTLKGQ